MKPDTALLDPAAEAMLDMRIADLRREAAEIQAPPALERALLGAFRERAARASRPRLWWMPPLALAAAIGIVSWMIRGVTAPQPAANPSAAIEAEGEPFLALRPLERIALEPGTTVVTTEFPRALLADWGLPVSPDRAGEPVRAEMLYSRDGEALAIRLVN
jgi:hypothetical protein